MTSILISLIVLAQLSPPPTISGVAPTPLAIGGVAEVSGANFIVDGTSVTIDAVAQQVVNIQLDKVRFVVATDTPLGTRLLVVTTLTGSAETSVVVAPPAPKITTIAPDTLTLGELETVQGESLDTVTSVTVGGVAATIREQTELVLVFEVPFDASILGSQQLALNSPQGPATRMVDVLPPAPDIDSIGPNPARNGDLVTIRGTIVPINLKAKIGLVDAPVVEAAAMAVTVLVPNEVSEGPHDVIVSVGQLTSAPAGPLYILPGDPKRPVVVGVYPVNVARGGAVWLIGTNLDTVTEATHGLVVLGCDKRACRLDTTGVVVGQPFTGAVTSPAGSAIFTMQVTDDPLIVPQITSVEPNPAFRGQPLTIHGTDLGGTRSVVIGGRTQSIAFFDTTKIELGVHPETPMGAQQLFIAGAGGSEPFNLTVLDRFPTVDEDPADTVDDAVADGGDVAPPKKKGDGCTGGGESSPMGRGFAVALAAAWAASRRRRA